MGGRACGVCARSCRAGGRPSRHRAHSRAHTRGLRIRCRWVAAQAFCVADDILRQGVVGISDIIIKPGLINVDFADVQAIMGSSGLALMGIGTAEGKGRARDAAIAALSSPLIDFPINKVFSPASIHRHQARPTPAASKVLLACSPRASWVDAALRRRRVLSSPFRARVT